MIETILLITGLLVWILIALLLVPVIIPGIIFIIAFMLMKLGILVSVRRKLVEVLEVYVKFLEKIIPKNITL